MIMRVLYLVTMTKFLSLIIESSYQAQRTTPEKARTTEMSC